MRREIKKNLISRPNWNRRRLILIACASYRTKGFSPKGTKLIQIINEPIIVNNLSQKLIMPHFGMQYRGSRIFILHPGDSMDTIFCVRMACDISHQLVPFFQLLMIFVKFWDRNFVVRRLKNSQANFDKQMQRNEGVVFSGENFHKRVLFRYQYRIRSFSFIKPRL